MYGLGAGADRGIPRTVGQRQHRQDPPLAPSTPVRRQGLATRCDSPWPLGTVSRGRVSGSRHGRFAEAVGGSVPLWRIRLWAAGRDADPPDSTTVVDPTDPTGRTVGAVRAEGEASATDAREA